MLAFFEFLQSNIAILGTAAGAVALVFLTPLGPKVIERLFSRGPEFAVTTPILDNSLVLYVKPANSVAQRKRALGVRFRGINMPGIGTLDSRGGELRWRVDLSKIERIRDVLAENTDYEFQFFFVPNSASEKVTIRFVGGIPQSTPFTGSNSENGEKRTVSIKHIAEIGTNIRSDTKLVLDFDNAVITRAFPTTGSHLQWTSVHDGKEATIRDVHNFELTGSADLLAEPRYAWVLNFRDCHSLALRDLTFGHTEEGYCRGGVLRFQSCTDVILENCDLFGCGTYGLEFIDCSRIEVVDTKIRQCSYGVVNLRNVSHLTFRNCGFLENRGFELFQIEEPIERTMIKGCEFLRNRIEGAIFCFGESVGNFNFYANDCRFIENTYAEVSNNHHVLTVNDNNFHSNVVRDTLWSRTRKHCRISA